MSAAVTELVPPPAVVRDRLAQHQHEGRVLRALLRLSMRAAEPRPTSSQSVRGEPRQAVGAC